MSCYLIDSQLIFVTQPLSCVDLNLEFKALGPVKTVHSLSTIYTSNSWHYITQKFIWT